MGRNDRTLPLCDTSSLELALTQDATLIRLTVLIFRQMGELYP